jgi:hypothetical protein
MDDVLFSNILTNVTADNIKFKSLVPIDMMYNKIKFKISSSSIPIANGIREIIASFTTMLRGLNQ